MQRVILLLLLSTGIYVLSQQQEAFHTCCLRCLHQLCPAPAALGNVPLTQTSPVLLHPIRDGCLQAASAACYMILQPCFWEIKDPNL